MTDPPTAATKPPPGAVVVTLRRAAALDDLAQVWRELEARSAGSFFQSWTWVGCLAAERFPDPVLLTATQDGVVVALALCNRRATAWVGETFWLGQSGTAAWDHVFVEHNGPLVARDASAALGPCLDALLRQGLGNGRLGGGLRKVVLDGVGDAVRCAAASLGCVCRVREVRAAPFVDLAALEDEQGLLARLGRSTRAQLRRSQRLYAAEGPLCLSRAGTVDEALGFLDALAALHQASWQRRDRPGAFAEPNFARFHRALIAEGLPRDAVDLLRISAGTRPIGYLYNFRWQRRVYAYQSGFDYTGSAQLKPGLTCHALAIETYRAQGFDRYDFLAGDDRYKMSFATGTERLSWLDLARPASPFGLALRLGGWLGRKDAGHGLAGAG